MQNLKYITMFMIGLLAGSLGMYEFSHSDSHFEIGDRVQTTDEWNNYYTPINGNVTDTYDYQGETLIRVDCERFINEYWFEKYEF